MPLKGTHQKQRTWASCADDTSVPEVQKIRKFHPERFIESHVVLFLGDGVAVHSHPQKMLQKNAQHVFEHASRPFDMCFSSRFPNFTRRNPGGKKKKLSNLKKPPESAPSSLTFPRLGGNKNWKSEESRQNRKTSEESEVSEGEKTLETTRFSNGSQVVEKMRRVVENCSQVAAAFSAAESPNVQILWQSKAF